MINFSIIYKSEHWTDRDKYHRIAEQVCREVVKHFQLETAEVAIVLADNEFVRGLNNKYRGQDKPTNVLSFPADDEFNCEAVEQLGDVIMAYETVLAEAGGWFDNHFTHLLLHGLLHLLGLDHIDEQEAQQMEQLERVVLKDLGIADPYS